MTAKDYKLIAQAKKQPISWDSGQKWGFPSITKVGNVITLNLCQKLPGKI